MCKPNWLSDDVQVLLDQSSSGVITVKDLHKALLERSDVPPLFLALIESISTEKKYLDLT